MTKMNIAQGLRRVKKLKGQLGELSRRAATVVSHREGENPAFNFVETREALATAREELVTLEAKVACANATTSIEVEGKEMTIAEAIRRLQETKAEISWLESLPLRTETERVPESVFDEASGRYAQKYREIRWVSLVSEPERVEQVQKLRDRFEAINDAVESANHRTPI